MHTWGSVRLNKRLGFRSADIVESSRCNGRRVFCECIKWAGGSERQYWWFANILIFNTLVEFSEYSLLTR